MHVFARVGAGRQIVVTIYVSQVAGNSLPTDRASAASPHGKASRFEW